ncbi:MAG: hypothetical protein ACHQ51_12390 [Elusimicrobiota bacterium]
MKIKSRAMRTTAAMISLALIHATFGPQAWAQFVPRVGDMSAPVGNGSQASGSASSINTSNNAPALQITPAAMTNPAAGIGAAPAALAPLPVSAIASDAPALAMAGRLTPSAASSAVRPAARPSAAAALSPVAAASTPEKGIGSAKAALPSARAAAEAPMADAAPANAESGAKETAVAGRVSRRIAELKNFFSGRKDAGFTPDGAAAGVQALGSAPAVRSSGLAAASKGSDDKVSQGGGDNGPPAPPSAPESPKNDGKSGKSKAAWLGLGAAGASIIAYGLTMQMGLEAQGVAMPQLTENAFKDFTLLPLVTVFASIGSMIGQPMSKYFTEHFGLAKTFYAAHALRAVSLGGMVLLFGTGMMSMPLMMGFYLLNGIVTGVAATAEGTLKKLILAEKGVSQQSFRTWWQLLAETLAVPAPIFFGGLVHTLGAIGAPMVTALYPVTILLGLILAYILRVYPLKDVKKASAQAAQDFTKAAEAAPAPAPAPEASPAPAPAKTGVWQGVKNAAAKIFNNMEEGKNYVLGIPYLKYSLAAGVAFDMFNIIIYRLISPGYGKMTGGVAGLSAVQGNMVGMFSLGGLLLSVVFITMENVAKKRAAKNPLSPEAAAAAERTSMLRWSMAAIPAIALLATMAFHIALPLAPLMFMGTNWMPASMLAAALIPFGFFQVAASIKTNSYFQEKLPQDAGKVQKALAFAGSVMTAMSIVTMLAMRPLFSAVDVFNPFPWLTAALLPIAVGIFFLWRKMAKATTPEAMAAADAAQAQREAGEGAAPKAGGAYVGLILGIVAAAVVITALPMIPGMAGVIAGLGVLGRFALNLGLTLLIPLGGYLIGRAKGKAKDRATPPAVPK